MYDSITKAFGLSATKTAPLNSAAGDILQSGETDREMRRTLTRALLKGEYRHWRSRWEYHPPACHGRAWRSTLSRRTPQSNQLSSLLQSTRQRRHPTRGHQGWQEYCSPSPSARPPVLGGTVTLHQHHHQPTSYIITLYTKKGYRSDCNNYRRISLLRLRDCCTELSNSPLWSERLDKTRWCCRVCQLCSSLP